MAGKTRYDRSPLADRGVIKRPQLGLADQAQATMPSGGPKISCAASGSRKAAAIEKPFVCSTHHPVLASWLAICSTT
jgi:hypothetical protein